MWLSYRGAFIHKCDSQNLIITAKTYSSASGFHEWWYGDTLQRIETQTPKGFHKKCKTNHYRGFKNLKLDMRGDIDLYVSEEQWDGGTFYRVVFLFYSS